MHNPDDESLLSSRLEEVAPNTSAISSPTVIPVDSETGSQVPCWRGAKACFCTLRRYLLVAICDILIITVLCVSLMEPRWLMIRQGRCIINGGEGRYIGIDFFFSRGLYAETPNEIVFRYGEKNEMINCLNAAAVTILRCAVTLIICCICLTLVSFFFCIVKLRIQLFLIIRKYAVFNIVTAIICAAVLLIIFCASDEISTIQQGSIKLHDSILDSNSVPAYPYAKTDFSTGYYLILLAAFLSLLAVGVTLIDCACYHQVFSSARHSSRGYDRLLTPSSNAPVPITVESSGDTTNQRTSFAVSSTRSSRTTFVTNQQSSSLLPPPPSYSCAVNSAVVQSESTVPSSSTDSSGGG